MGRKILIINSALLGVLFLFTFTLTWYVYGVTNGVMMNGSYGSVRIRKNFWQFHAFILSIFLVVFIFSIISARSYYIKKGKSIFMTVLVGVQSIFTGILFPTVLDSGQFSPAWFDFNDVLAVLLIILIFKVIIFALYVTSIFVIYKASRKGKYGKKT